MRRDINALSSDHFSIFWESGKLVNHLFFTVSKDFGAMKQVISLEIFFF